jgi:hypothetical protein
MLLLALPLNMPCTAASALELLQPLLTLLSCFPHHFQLYVYHVVLHTVQQAS